MLEGGFCTLSERDEPFLKAQCGPMSVAGRFGLFAVQSQESGGREGLAAASPQASPRPRCEAARAERGEQRSGTVRRGGLLGRGRLGRLRGAACRPTCC